jgi:hypothetical protein
MVYAYMVITVASRSKVWTVFARSNTGIVGLNPTWGMDVCGCLFCLLFCVYLAALRRADPPSKESYRVKDQETEKVSKVQQRAVEP